MPQSDGLEACEDHLVVVGGVEGAVADNPEVET
jgi:hypothetical protein